MVGQVRSRRSTRCANGVVTNANDEKAPSNSRSVLADASNRRQTRSQSAGTSTSSTAETKPFVVREKSKKEIRDDANATNIPPAPAPRRSARLSGESAKKEDQIVASGCNEKEQSLTNIDSNSKKRKHKRSAKPSLSEQAKERKRQKASKNGIDYSTSSDSPTSTASSDDSETLENYNRLATKSRAAEASEDCGRLAARGCSETSDIAYDVSATSQTRQQRGRSRTRTVLGKTGDTNECAAARTSSKKGSLIARRKSGDKKTTSKKRTTSRTRSLRASKSRASIGDTAVDCNKPNPRFHEDQDDPRNYNLSVVNFDASKYTRGLNFCDIPNRSNVLETPEYVSDIFQRLYKAEEQYLVTPYVHNQKEINVAMRCILVDWLVEVHMKFRLEPETLFLCINIMDRYLSKVQVKRSKLQLVGITALLIASKYEEIYPPEVRDCVYVTDRTYTRQEVIDMELSILNELRFMISAPTAYPFLQRFLHITGATPTMKLAANFFLERVLQEHDFLEYRPSLVSAAAVVLAINDEEIRTSDCVRTPLPHIPLVLVQYTDFKADEIHHVASLMANAVGSEVVTGAKRPLSAVKNKYSSRHHQRISQYPAPSVRHIRQGES